jgi:hypothetical protein
MAYSVIMCLFKTRCVVIGGGHLNPVSATTNWITYLLLHFKAYRILPEHYGLITTNIKCTVTSLMHTSRYFKVVIQ